MHISNKIIFLFMSWFVSSPCFSASIEILPDDIHKEIVKRLTVQSAYRFSACNKKLRKTLDDFILHHTTLRLEEWKKHPFAQTALAHFGYPPATGKTSDEKKETLKAWFEKTESLGGNDAISLLDDTYITEGSSLNSLIESLSFSDIGLKLIPHQIKECKKITSLCTNENPIVEWPDFLSECPSIYSMNFRGHRIGCFPSRVNNSYSMLTILNLSRSKQLKRIPNFIAGLRSLTSINFWNTGLSKLPNSLLNLDKLLYIDLGSCKFTEFPPILLKMRSLKKINLSNNKISNISLDLGKWKSLGSVNLSNNNIKIISPFMFTKSVSLYLSKNPLSDDTKQANFNNRRTHNPYAFFADILSDKETASSYKNIVTEIYLVNPYDCYRFSKKVKSIEELSNMKKITITGASIQWLQWIFKLDKLEHLDLSKNEIKALPPFPENSLQNLKTIKLCFNPIHYISEKLMFLPKIDLLDITETNFVLMWNFTEKHNLKTLIQSDGKSVQFSSKRTFQTITAQTRQKKVIRKNQ